MTRRERWLWAFFLIAGCAVSISVNWADAQRFKQQKIQRDPQPRLPMRGDFEVFEFENGSQWYIKRGSINAIWGVPPADQERLGMKTKIFGVNYQITLPYDVIEVVDELYREDIEQLQEIRKQIQKIRDERDTVPP